MIHIYYKNIIISINFNNKFHSNLNNNLKIGIFFSSFGVSTLFYNIFCTYMVNPDNLKATIKVREEQNLMKYFSTKVTRNTPFMI